MFCGSVEVKRRPRPQRRGGFAVLQVAFLQQVELYSLCSLHDMHDMHDLHDLNDLHDPAERDFVVSLLSLHDLYHHLITLF
jgi:hypothetical protein